MPWRTGVAGCLVLIAIGLTGAGSADARPAPVPAADREVRFVVDGSTTYGTVHVPTHRAGARLAAALLLPGSGGTDRNGNEPTAPVPLTPATLRLLAEELGRDGLVTLRFDKYFTGATGPGQYQSHPADADMDAFTRQAAAAYALLRVQPEVDRRPPLILGHSEGGLRALLLARTVRPAPTGLVLLAPQDLRILDMIEFQLAGTVDRGVGAGKITAEDARTDKATITQAVADFRAGRPVSTAVPTPWLATSLQRIFNPVGANYLRTDDAIYPPDVAADLAPGTPVLLTCGTADTQVPCATTTPLLAALHRAHARGPGLVALPGLDHFLHPAGTPENTQTIDPGVQQALDTFVAPLHPGR